VSRTRNRRLARVHDEQVITAIGLVGLGPGLVALSIVRGDQGIDELSYSLVVGPLLPIAFFLLLRGELRRNARTAGPISEHQRIDSRSTTRRREILQLALGGPVVALLVLATDDGLFYGIFLITGMAPVLAYTVRWVDAWEAQENAHLYRQRGSWRATYVRVPVNGTRPPTASR
jgi:hypothetical protein